MFSLFFLLSFIIISIKLGFDSSIQGNLEKRKRHAKIFSCEKEIAILLMKFGQI